jgi:hypothetical protein
VVEVISMDENDFLHIWHDADRTHNDSQHLMPLEAFNQLSSRGKYFSLTKKLLDQLRKKINELQGS